MINEEYQAILERINGYTEEARKELLIYQGWVCSHPEVEKVWFSAFFKGPFSDRKSEIGIQLEILFKNGNRWSIEASGDLTGQEETIMPALARKGHEYLRNGGKGISPINS
jgi:hypothetical protein